MVAEIAGRGERAKHLPQRHRDRKEFKDGKEVASQLFAAEAESAFGGSSSSSPLGMPSAVDSTSRSRRNSSSEGAGGSQDDVAGPGATAAPVTGAANSVGTSWSFSAKSSMSGLKESCCALECPESGDLA